MHVDWSAFENGSLEKSTGDNGTGREMIYKYDARCVIYFSKRPFM